jgi:hypothetical protein
MAWLDNLENEDPPLQLTVMAYPYQGTFWGFFFISSNPSP